MSADMEKLDNAVRTNRKKDQLGKALLATKLVTPLGKLRQLLMILEAELNVDNRPAALDVLWAIEQSGLYLQALGEAVDVFLVSGICT